MPYFLIFWAIGLITLFVILIACQEDPASEPYERWVVVKSTDTIHVIHVLHQGKLAWELISNDEDGGIWYHNGELFDTVGRGRILIRNYKLQQLAHGGSHE